MADLTEILEQFDVESWVDEQGLEFKETQGHSGRQLNLKECPCCSDRRWRVYVNAETGIGNCFVCDTKFSKWSFVREVLGIDNKRTLVEIKRHAGIRAWRPPKKVEPPPIKLAQKPSLALPISVSLPYNGQNLQYLEDRGVNSAVAAAFELRYCEDAWWNYIREDGQPGGQNFGNRVLIPVRDLDGAIVTFQGRDIGGLSDRKYLFPATLPGTGKFLYNGHKALGVSRLAIGEGVFDVIAQAIAFEADPAFADIVPVGTFGKHLSMNDRVGDDQISRFLTLKARGLKEVTIMWDGEPSALVAALEAGDKLRGFGLVVRIALLPAGKDPNEVEPEIVRKAFSEAIFLTPATATRLRLLNPYR